MTNAERVKAEIDAEIDALRVRRENGEIAHGQFTDMLQALNVRAGKRMRAAYDLDREESTGS
jgi:hypothetical protein